MELKLPNSKESGINFVVAPDQYKIKPILYLYRF